MAVPGIHWTDSAVAFPDSITELIEIRGNATHDAHPGDGDCFRWAGHRVTGQRRADKKGQPRLVSSLIHGAQGLGSSG